VACRWVFCRQCGSECSAAMSDGGFDLGGFSYFGGPSQEYDPEDDPPEHPCADSCVVGFFQAKFDNVDLAEAIVGAGNYVSHPTGFGDPLSGVLTEPISWVLLGDGSGTFTRDPSRPCAAEVQTATIDYVGPTTAARVWFVPTSVTLNGTHTWTRKAASPVWDPVAGNWGDFEEWELTTPADPPLGGEPTEGQPRCVGFEFYVDRVGLLWDEAAGPPAGLRLQFKSDKAEEPLPDSRNCCDTANFEVCIPRVGSNTTMDGWGFGATYSGDSEDQTCEARDGSESDVDYGATVTVTLGGQVGFIVDGNGDCPPRGTINLQGPAPGTYACWRLPCADENDLTELPSVADWELYDCGPVAGVEHNTCEVELITFDTEDCEDPGPPEECPDSHCRYVWNVATQEWQRAGGMNCDDCPETWGAPAPGEDDPQIMYVCCDGVDENPGGDPGPPSGCLNFWCRYLWNGTTWVLDANNCDGPCPIYVGPAPEPGQWWYHYECCPSGPVDG